MVKSRRIKERADRMIARLTRVAMLRHNEGRADKRTPLVCAGLAAKEKQADRILAKVVARITASQGRDGYTTQFVAGKSRMRRVKWFLTKSRVAMAQPAPTTEKAANVSKKSRARRAAAVAENTAIAPVIRLLDVVDTRPEDWRVRSSPMPHEVRGLSARYPECAFTVLPRFGVTHALMAAKDIHSLNALFCMASIVLKRYTGIGLMLYRGCGEIDTIAPLGIGRLPKGYLEDAQVYADLLVAECFDDVMRVIRNPVVVDAMANDAPLYHDTRWKKMTSGISASNLEWMCLCGETCGGPIYMPHAYALMDRYADLNAQHRLPAPAPETAAPAAAAADDDGMLVCGRRRFAVAPIISEDGTTWFPPLPGSPHGRTEPTRTAAPTVPEPSPATPPAALPDGANMEEWQKWQT